MSRLYSLAFVLLFAQFAIAQKQTTKMPDPKKYAASITTEDLSRHLYIIAGAEMEGRETATEGQRKAAAYIEQHFKIFIPICIIIMFIVIHVKIIWWRSKY
jgi:hypothetical protein